MKLEINSPLAKLLQSANYCPCWTVNGIEVFKMPISCPISLSGKGYCPCWLEESLHDAIQSYLQDIVRLREQWKADIKEKVSYHRIIKEFELEGTLKDHPVLPPAMGREPSSAQDCSKLHSSWLSTLSGTGSPQLLWGTSLTILIEKNLSYLQITPLLLQQQFKNN